MNIFGIDILNTLITAGVGALVVIALDKLYKLLIINFFPTKYLLDFVKYIDEEYLDKFKKKYPEAGLEAEKEIADTLREMADIIEDK